MTVAVEACSHVLLGGCQIPGVCDAAEERWSLLLHPGCFLYTECLCLRRHSSDGTEMRS